METGNSDVMIIKLAMRVVQSKWRPPNQNHDQLMNQRLTGPG